MASLRRLNNSPFYIACITLPGGTRTNRSTKTSQRRIAQRLADEWQVAADNARMGQAVATQARQVFNDILALAGQEQLNTETVEAFLQRWLCGRTNGGTARRYQSAVNGFLDYLGAKKRSALGEIGHQDILRFIESRVSVGVASKTLSVDVGALGAAFGVACKLGLITSNPAERALAIRPIAVQSNRRACFTPEQISTLIKEAGGDWKTAILLGYYTGARLGDCAHMRWENVNLEAGVIEFVPKKTGKRLVVPIHPELLAHLRALGSEKRRDSFLCPSLAIKSTGGKNGLSAQFKRILGLAQVDTQTGRGMGIRQFAKLSFHSLRHSFNSALANNGVDQETRMKLTGHGNVAINNDYTHLELSKLGAAIEKLPALRP